jgi:hypothetical protein
VVEYRVYIFFQNDTLGRMLSYSGKVSDSLLVPAPTGKLHNSITIEKTVKKKILFRRFFINSDNLQPVTVSPLPAIVKRVMVNGKGRQQSIGLIPSYVFKQNPSQDPKY